MTDSDNRILSEIMRLHSEIGRVISLTGNKEDVKSVAYRQRIEDLKNILSATPLISR